MADDNQRPFPADDPDCELCQADRFTHWYAENEHGWVADCEVCAVPMVVWWHHGTDPSDNVRDELLETLRLVADDRFGPQEWSFDTNMRQVHNHFHAHARDRGWWNLRFTRPVSVYRGVGAARHDDPQ